MEHREQLSPRARDTSRVTCRWQISTCAEWSAQAEGHDSTRRHFISPNVGKFRRSGRSPTRGWKHARTHGLFRRETVGCLRARSGDQCNSIFSRDTIDSRTDPRGENHPRNFLDLSRAARSALAERGGAPALSAIYASELNEVPESSTRLWRYLFCLGVLCARGRGGE